MEIVAEELDVRNGASGDVGIGKMAREKDEGNIADVFRVFQTRNLPDFERGFAVREEYLRCVLNLW